MQQPLVPLSQFPLHKKGRIEKIKTEAKLAQRFLSMGITIGSVIQITGIAPFGDPIQIKIKGSKYTIRKSEAKHIFILPLEK